MKKFRKSIIFFFTCVLLVAVCVSVAIAAETFPSETNCFVPDHFVDPINQEEPFFESVLPRIEANIKENNKHTITPYYDAFPKLNNPENFQGLGSTTYANINGKTVTAEALYRKPDEALDDPNTSLGLLLFQCIKYKIAHPEADVSISFAFYRTSASHAVCVIPGSRYYGYGRLLYGVSYDEHGFVRVSYMLVEAARMGIDVTIVSQLSSYGRKQYDPATGKLRQRNNIDHDKYFRLALESECYDKYEPGKKVSDFMRYVKVGWNVEDKTQDMMHTKTATVSHYIATDGTEHQYGVFFGSANHDDLFYNGANANNGTQSGVIISDHEDLFRVTNNYVNLMYKYSGQEEMYVFRRIMTNLNNKQIELINSGRGDEIAPDEQIVYLGSETDPVFELYFTPLGGGTDEWNTVTNPLCKYIDKLMYSEDYIEFIWNCSGFGKCNLSNTLSDVLRRAYCENPNVRNQLTIRGKSAFNSDAIKKLDVGTQIGYRNIKSGSGIHAKDMLVTYVENGVRHRVSLLTSCNFYMIAFNQRANTFLVINETDETGGDFYYALGEKFSFGMLDRQLMLSPGTIKLEAGQTYDLDVHYTAGKKLTWSSSDNKIATVKDGKITAVKKGKATITATDGVNTDTVTVNIVGCLDCQIPDGLTFNINEQYKLEEKFKAMPRTFEATFTVDKASLKGNATLLGNDGLFDPALVFGLNKSGQPRVTVRKTAGNSGDKTYTFKNVNVATGKKVNLAIVMDSAKKNLHCYVNGKLAQTLTNISIPDYEQKYTFAVGGDYRNGNATYFPGVIHSVSVWSDVRTDSEISKDYSNGVDSSDKSLLAHYDFVRCEKHFVDDYSLNDNDLYKIKLWLDKDEVEPVPDYEYSFAVVGDTQTMCEKDPEAMESVYDWIIQNKETHKIEYVIGLGDITDDSTDIEWERASKYISKLNGKIPYSLTRGNHDDWDDFNRLLHNGYYEKTVDGVMNAGDFNLSDPVGQPGVITKVDSNGNVSYITREDDVPEGGLVKGDLTNSYRYFSVQGTDYLIMTLDFAPNTATLKWADSVIKAHPDHKVIITTHCYMYRDGTTLDAGDCYPATYYTGYTDQQNGDDMWKKSFSKHENVLMVLSGHDPWQHIAYRQDIGEKGNTVTQMLIDAQYVDNNIGSTGMVAMFYFSNDGETLTVRYYSVGKDCYGSELSQFTIHLNHSYKRVTEKKATLSENGRIVEKCECGAIKEGSEKTVYAPKTISLSKTAYTYNGKVQTPSVTVKDSKGKTLGKDTDYTVKYESGRKAPGQYTVTVTFIGNYSGEKKLTYTIAPKVTSKVSAVQSTKAIKLTWNKVTGADGYRVYQYNTKTKKWESIKTISATSYKVEKLTAGTTYKFRIKAYTKDDGTIWGAETETFTTATKPATPKITKLTTTKGKASFTWSNVSGESGYEVYYSTKKDSGFKKVISYKANAVKGSKSKLTSGKTYYFKVRAYKTVGESKLYSGWSSVKSIKIK